MARVSNREKILAEGLRVVHQHGFAGTSVRDIVQAAGVPQGSFTNHFRSKEAFGLEIIDMYFERMTETMRNTLRNDALPPLQRLRDYIDASRAISRPSPGQQRNGCLFGNFSAEISEHSPLLRQRVAEVFAAIQDSVAYCLRAAVKSGELPADYDCDTVAGFIVSSLQGAYLVGKAQQSSASLERFKQVLFTQVLR